MTTLFSALDMQGLALPNRIVMAPMTRARTDQPGNVPNAMMADYYAQRASAGLIVSEATQISPQGQGYSFTPGIHSRAQIAGWRGVTDAVHAAGGRMFLQLWHVGRMSHESFHPDGRPVAPSALSPDASVWVADPETGDGRMVPSPLPRALETDEIPAIVDQFRQAAANAADAGFDGVEIHGANGYLIDQFLGVAFNEEEQGVYDKNWSQIRTYMLEKQQAWILGGGIEAEWDDYMATLNKMGFNDVLAAMQSAYDRQYGG